MPGSNGRVPATVVELAPGRLAAFMRSRAAEVLRMLRPRSVNVVRVNGRVVKDEVLRLSLIHI